MRPIHLVPGLADQREPFQETRLRERKRLVLPNGAPQPHKSAWPRPCTRGTAGEGKVTVARLERALETVAALVIDDEVYLPIFQRLEAELKEARRTASTLDRARKIARGARSHNAAR
ncbi:hypothetical protein [Aquicoccus sp.]|uniref:hypothetical protein n=1 Tax=Aquicoccus sp. TaxID=2055851 RepID=UPI003569AE93